MGMARARRLKWITENRLLAFIQIALAVGGASIVIAVIHSLSSLPWLYLAAIFCFVAAASAGGLYRVFAPATSAPQPELRPQRRAPTLYEQLQRALKVGDEIATEIEWQRMGRSLRLNDWRVSVRSLIPPEYTDEISQISQSGADDLETFEAVKELINRIMRDPNYRR